MDTRSASCTCGDLVVTCHGDPVRVSVCHCLACKTRTGSAFGVHARFATERVVAAEGRAYTRVADSGNAVTYHFCPRCGSTVWLELSALPGFVAVAVGAFGDAALPAPTVAVYTSREVAWCAIADVERWD